MNAASITSKYRTMPFMLKYAQNFVQSDICNKIHPREIKDANMLDLYAPYLLNAQSSQQSKDMEPTRDEEYKNADLTSINKGINAPTYDLLDRGGKQWRPILGLMLAEALGRQDLDDHEKNKDIYYAAGLTELVHNSSLIIDDIEDDSEKRRGDFCVHKKFGVDVAINAGNYLMVAPITQMHKFVSEEHQLALFRIYSQEM